MASFHFGRNFDDVRSSRSSRTFKGGLEISGIGCARVWQSETFAAPCKIMLVRSIEVWAVHVFMARDGEKAKDPTTCVVEYDYDERQVGVAQGG